MPARETSGRGFLRKEEIEYEESINIFKQLYRNCKTNNVIRVQGYKNIG
jgi:hypothetical protein